MDTAGIRHKLIAVLSAVPESPSTARAFIDPALLGTDQDSLDRAIDELILEGTLCQRAHRVTGERMIASRDKAAA